MSIEERYIEVCEDVGKTLERLRKHVTAAQREYRQGWAVSADLEGIEVLVVELRRLHDKQVDLKGKL